MIDSPEKQCLLHNMYIYRVEKGKEEIRNEILWGFSIGTGFSLRKFLKTFWTEHVRI